MNTSQLFPRPHPQTAGRVIDGEAILIMADDSEINVLNELGSRIFELSDGTRSLREIAATLAAEFDVAVNDAEQDALEFLEQLVNRKVMVFSQERET